jgi:hypothetical protein
MTILFITLSNYNYTNNEDPPCEGSREHNNAARNSARLRLTFARSLLNEPQNPDNETTVNNLGLPTLHVEPPEAT